MPDVGKRVTRVERREHPGPADHVRKARKREDGKPRRHHRPEQRAHLAAAVALDGKHAQQDTGRDRHHVGL
jgi:hypothetical protein